MSILAVDTALQLVARFLNNVKSLTNYYSDTSLADVSKLTNVQPLCVFSRDCSGLEYANDISQSLLNLFCSYYLQAINILTRVDSAEIVRVLDRLNPDRDETGFLLTDSLATESIQRMRLATEDFRMGLPTRRMGDRLALETTARNFHDENYHDAKNANERVLQEAANLSVGKLLRINMAYNSAPGTETDILNPATKDKRLTLDINVRLLASFLPNESINQILVSKKEDMTLSDRWMGYRSGRLEFIKDLIFCQDVIDEYKRAMALDNTGTMQEIVRRVNNAKKFGLLTKNPSLVAASSLFVISEEVARNMESELGGKLSSPSVRKKAFDSTYAMIIAVVNRDYQTVTFYVRNINQPTEVRVSSLKQSNRNSGPDIMEVMKSFNMGMPATF